MTEKPEYIEGPAGEEDEVILTSYAFQETEVSKINIESNENGKENKSEHVLCTDLKAGLVIPTEEKKSKDNQGPEHVQ